MRDKRSMPGLHSAILAMANKENTVVHTELLFTLQAGSHGDEALRRNAALIDALLKVDVAQMQDCLSTTWLSRAGHTPHTSRNTSEEIAAFLAMVTSTFSETEDRLACISKNVELVARLASDSLELAAALLSLLIQPDRKTVMTLFQATMKLPAKAMPDIDLSNVTVEVQRAIEQALSKAQKAAKEILSKASSNFSPHEVLAACS